MTVSTERWVGFVMARATLVARYKERQVQLQEWGITVLRVVTGIVFLMSGVQRLFGGVFSATVEALGQRQGVSLPLLPATAITTAVTLGAFLGGAALILGLLTRWVSVALAIAIVGDILLFHPPRGLFVKDTAYEYALLQLATCAALALTGPGKAALSSILGSRVRAILPRLLR